MAFKYPSYHSESNVGTGRKMARTSISALPLFLPTNYNLKAPSNWTTQKSRSQVTFF